MRHLVLHLESPLMAFGGEAIDQIGVTRRFPSVSMLTGLLANALGWNRTDGAYHQRLQDRLVFAARIDREPAGGAPLSDFQTAQLGAGDRGWTTWGRPESRGGGPATYDSPHLRFRDYLADMIVTVALRLDPPGDHPDLDAVARALEEPARPLFIGRKPCLPSASLFAGFGEADGALAALLAWPLAEAARGEAAPVVRAIWPASEAPAGITPAQSYTLTDQRNWASSGLHGGGRLVCEGLISLPASVPQPSPAGHDG